MLSGLPELRDKMNFGNGLLNNLGTWSAQIARLIQLGEWSAKPREKLNLKNILFSKLGTWCTITARTNKFDK